VTGGHVACHCACPQEHESLLMKSGRQALDLAQPTPTLHGLLVSVDSCSSADRRNVTSLQALTSQDLSLALRSSRQQQRSELHITPSTFTQFKMSAVGRINYRLSLVLLRYAKYCFRSINDTINQNYRDKRYDTIIL